MKVKYEFDEKFIPINIFGIQKKYIEHQFKNLGIEVLLGKRVKIQNKYAYTTKVSNDQFLRISNVYQIIIDSFGDIDSINVFPK